MSAVTVFRDKPPRGLSFPIGLTDADQLVREATCACYFVNQSTWVRQAFALTENRLPLLRLQRRRPYLRVGNEKVSPSAEACDHHLIVYAVPWDSREAARRALLDLPQLAADCILHYSQQENQIDVIQKLPDWI